MKKMVRKLTLHRETLCALADLRLVVGANTDRTVCVTGCVTNCAICNFSAGTNCC
jgi:hypothetical protein